MKKIFLSAAFAVIVFSGFAQKAYSFQLKPGENEKYDAITNIKSTIKQSMMGQEMVIDIAYNIDMLYDIQKAGKNMLFTSTYKKLAMDMAMMGQNIKMSSEDDDTNPANKSFRALKDAKVSMTVTPEGKVMDVKGADELLDRVADASRAEKEGLKNFIGKENIKNAMEHTFSYLPAKPVKVGESWTSLFSIESPYKLSSNNTYKLVKVENGLAYVDVTGTLTTNGAQKMVSNGMEMLIDLSGTQTGSMVFDENNGMISSSDLVQSMKGKMEVMGQEVPMEVKNDTNVKMVKK